MNIQNQLQDFIAYFSEGRATIEADDFLKFGLKGEFKHYQKGQFIIHQGQPAPKIHFLLKGYVRYFSLSEEGKEFTQSFASSPGIAGSTKIGKRCMIGGQVGIVGHLTIGNNVKIAAQSGIGSNLKDDVIVQGSPAFEVGNYRRSYVSFRRLPETLRTIEQQLKELMKG